MTMQVTSHADKVHEVSAYDPSGRRWHGVFASRERAIDWAEGRERGEPYDPIPPRGIR